MRNWKNSKGSGVSVTKPNLLKTIVRLEMSMSKYSIQTFKLSAILLRNVRRYFDY